MFWWIREVTQSEKCLLYKPGDLGVTPRTLPKEERGWDMEMHNHNFYTELDPWFTGHPACPTWWVPHSERPCLKTRCEFQTCERDRKRPCLKEIKRKQKTHTKKQGEWCLRNNFQGWSLTSTYNTTNTHKHTREHTCMHICTHMHFDSETFQM